jgi:hypothetical protein
MHTLKKDIEKSCGRSHSLAKHSQQLDHLYEQQGLLGAVGAIAEFT